MAFQAIVDRLMEDRGDFTAPAPSRENSRAITAAGILLLCYLSLSLFLRAISSLTDRLLAGEEFVVVNSELMLLKVRSN